nr:MAG TPA: hypothetical protein [Caudoviricetes sp.]
MSYIMQRYSCPWFFAITAKSSQKKCCLALSNGRSRDDYTR